MTLSYNLAYQEIILVHPTRRQIFAGKPYSTFWKIWDLLVFLSCLSFLKSVLSNSNDKVSENLILGPNRQNAFSHQLWGRQISALRRKTIINSRIQAKSEYRELMSEGNVSSFYWIHIQIWFRCAKMKIYTRNDLEFKCFGCILEFCKPVWSQCEMLLNVVDGISLNLFFFAFCAAAAAY